MFTATDFKEEWQGLEILSSVVIFVGRVFKFLCSLQNLTEKT